MMFGSRWQDGSLAIYQTFLGCKSCVVKQRVVTVRSALAEEGMRTSGAVVANVQRYLRTTKKRIAR